MNYCIIQYELLYNMTVYLGQSYMYFYSKNTSLLIIYFEKQSNM